MMTESDVFAALAKKHPAKYGFLAAGPPPSPPPGPRTGTPVRQRSAHTVNGTRLPPIPDTGPGTELRKLLQELGLVPAAGCGCSDRVSKMNSWTVEGCLANRVEIEEWLRSEAKKAGWFQLAKAAALSVSSGLAFHLNPRDPSPGLLAEALRRCAPPVSPVPNPSLPTEETR